MKIILILIAIFSAFNLSAHPGIGIVKDSKGNIYYTDLFRVWKITLQGQKSVAVPNVHTHELYMDAEDNLYGEHLWYNGEQLDTWGHYVWRLHNGKLDTVIAPSAGFLKDYSFVRDEHGNMYWAEKSERDSVTRFKKRSPDGNISTLMQAKLPDVKWLYATKQGVIYFINLVDLYTIDTAGKMALVAKDITKAPPGSPGSRHITFGIWTDNAGDIYVADFSGRLVKRISPGGKTENFAYSTSFWGPTGGLFDNKGNFWLLETSLNNEARVRKIPPAEFGKGAAPAIRDNYVKTGIVITGLVLVVLIVFYRIRRKRLMLSKR